MHPLKQKLKYFVDNKLDEAAFEEVEKHLKICQFCQEFVDDYKLLMASVDKAADEELPQRALALAEQLYQDGLKGKIIPLTPLGTEEKATALLLAADGKQEFRPRVKNLTTLCSENPDIVLRVMRDTDKGEDYLHLISDDPALSSNVMVQIPELNREFITDNHGRAILENIELEKLEQLKWQVKMPDAVFSLEPLIYDPDKTEYGSDIILETEKHDRIKVTFEGKTEGKQIAIEILELEGVSNFGQVKVILTQKESLVTRNAVPKSPITFRLEDNKAVINIRLFR